MNGLESLPEDVQKICLGKPICERCDSVAIEWLRYMGCSVF